METTKLQLTPEQRTAVSASPGGLVYFADKETGKTYLLVEQGALPELEEEYIRQGLELAREQIARGELSTATIDQVIAKAQQRQSVES
jgi:cellobiose phosphorylase